MGGARRGAPRTAREEATGAATLAQLAEVIGSPGWARTSDFLINSPSPRRSTRTHHDLSARHLWHSLGSHLLVDGGSPWRVGTNVEPARRSRGAVDVEPLRESLVRPDDPYLAKSHLSRDVTVVAAEGFHDQDLG
jgi:hypothetical protein